ncbi:MAG TPA: hypothetical protein VI564_01825 [Candidatus Nanoarchaeia archaeon]|nr:hypothetical protein [Candidatus Nanoarchaeia archaeon]
MNQLNPFLELNSFEPDIEFESLILENNSKETDLLIKRGYKIKKPIWTGLIAS